jgi:hypothetical protein
LAGLGYVGEMRELAEVITRDILVANPNVKYASHSGVEFLERAYTLSLCLQVV